MATLVEVVDALLAPTAAMASAVHTTAAKLAQASREVALELRRLCEGDLQGMFDGPTNVEVDWDGPAVVLDLSEVFNSEALGLLMTCASSWLQSAIARPAAGQRIVVVEEAWAVLANLGVARWLQALAKLARAVGGAARRGHPPPRRPPRRGRRGVSADAPGPGAAGRHRDPGHLRPTERRDRPGRRAPRAQRDRSAAAAEPGAVDGAVEGGAPITATWWSIRWATTSGTSSIPTPACAPRPGRGWRRDHAGAAPLQRRPHAGGGVRPLRGWPGRLGRGHAGRAAVGRGVAPGDRGRGGGHRRRPAS